MDFASQLRYLFAESEKRSYYFTKSANRSSGFHNNHMIGPGFSRDVKKSKKKEG
jgi:hypothetical protein